jgi:hypothetical protein
MFVDFAGDGENEILQYISFRLKLTLVSLAVFLSHATQKKHFIVSESQMSQSQ